MADNKVNPFFTIRLTKRFLENAKNEDVATLREKLAKVAFEAGFLDSYHTTQKGSLGELLIALVEGKAKVVRVEEVSAEIKSI